MRERLERGSRLQFELGTLFKQALDFDQCHRRIVLPDKPSICLADPPRARNVFLPIRHINREAHQILRLTTGGAQYGYYVRERLLELLRKVITDNVAVLVPRHLS